MNSGCRRASRASAAETRRRNTSAWNRGPLVVTVASYPWLCCMAWRISARSTTRAPWRSAERAGEAARKRKAAAARRMRKRGAGGTGPPDVLAKVLQVEDRGQHGAEDAQRAVVVGPVAVRVAVAVLVPAAEALAEVVVVVRLRDVAAGVAVVRVLE